ncbi:MAG: hypothetical protein ACE5RN_01575 [Nitrosopumilaceae archaeon]
MSIKTNYVFLGFIIFTLVGYTPSIFASGHFTLTNAPGDGTVTVGVNGFGGFGSFNGPNAEDALYDPVGIGAPAQTTLASAIAIRGGTGGTWFFLTSGTDMFGSGGLTNPTFDLGSTPTSATSSFSSNGLNFNLVQTLTKTFSGTTLTQTYTITNPTASTIDFDLLRYLDGDLQFDSSIDDGGGRIINLDGVEILFETDALGTSSSSSTFVGITAEEETALTTKNFEINKFPDLGSNIVFVGNPLGNFVLNDLDADEFIDAAYDVSLALSNEGFSLGAGESVVYVTKTVFGDGSPEDVEIDPPTEEVVGGITLRIDTLALLIAGAQSFTWIIPLSLSILGVGLFLVKGRLH